MKNLKLSRRGYCIGKFVFSNHMETSGENANCDLFVHELECSDQIFVCKICTDPFIVGKIPRPSKHFYLTTLQCRP